MDVWELLSVALTSLILLVVIHITVFFVVRTMYPPAPRVTFAPPVAPAPAPKPQVFTEPTKTEQQSVHVPTYEATVPTQPPSQEGATDLAALTGPAN